MANAKKIDNVCEKISQESQNEEGNAENQMRSEQEDVADKEKKLLLQQIMGKIRVDQSIMIRQKGASNNQSVNLAALPGQVIRLFENGQGCNLTLFNNNVIKEVDFENDDPSQINFQLANGFNNSQSSFADLHKESRASRHK